MISSAWTIFWTVLSVVGKDEPMSTPDAHKNYLCPNPSQFSYQLLQSPMRKVIQIINWPWKFLLRNEGIKIAILVCIFWVSPRSGHSLPGTDSFQVTPPLSPWWVVRLTDDQTNRQRIHRPLFAPHPVYHCLQWGIIPHFRGVSTPWARKMKQVQFIWGLAVADTDTDCVQLQRTGPF